MSDTLSVSGIDQIEQMVSEMYLSARLESGQPDATFTVTQTAVGPATLGRHFYDMTLKMDAEPLTTLAIVHTRGGSVTYRSRGKERRYGAGDLFLNTDPAETFTTAIDHLDADFAIFDPALLNDVARPVHGDTGPVRLTDYAPVSHRAANRWRATFEFARQSLAEPDLTPLVIGSISRLLAATTLATFPSNALLDPTFEDRHDAHPAALRRAVAFIETHPDLDLSVVDIARAAFVSPRALQLAFRRHLDTTPLRYLRRVRLDRAHADLQAGDPAHDTVTAIAARWGWARPSRFAADYLQSYGRHPHQTLRS